MGRALDPQLYRISDNDHLLLRTLFTLGFLNQLWSLDIRFLSNWPYWSISYEFWYYALFALLVFTSGRMRLVLVALWALLVGAGIGVSTGPSQASALSAVDPAVSGTASAMMALLRYVGGITGTTILSVALGESAVSLGRHHAALWVFTASFLASALCAVRLKPLRDGG